MKNSTGIKITIAIAIYLAVLLLISAFASAESAAWSIDLEFGAAFNIVFLLTFPWFLTFSSAGLWISELVVFYEYGGKKQRFVKYSLIYGAVFAVSLLLLLFWSI